MTAKELIEKLSEYDPNTKVYIDHDSYGLFDVEQLIYDDEDNYLVVSDIPF